MLNTYLGQTQRIDPSAYVAPTATVCGDVAVGPYCRIMFGACVVAEGTSIELGAQCIVMENAVIRSTDRHPTTIGAHCLIGPQAHLVGCKLEDCVFVATGASIFNGARLGYGAEVRINAVVHLRTELAAHTTVPIGWVAVGSLAQIFPPNEHDTTWAVQEPLNFPKHVCGVDRAPAGESAKPEVTRRWSQVPTSHQAEGFYLRMGAQRIGEKIRVTDGQRRETPVLMVDVHIAAQTT